MIKRPICINHNCNNLVTPNTYKKNGSISYRPICHTCHVGNDYSLAKKGITMFRKPFCDNTDGRLGFKCKAKIINICQIQIDHIDGNRYNNVPENCQNLCANCHSVKTMIQRNNITKYNKIKCGLNKNDR
jgi:hypothetical protein